MEFCELVKKRRSIRKYLSKPVPRTIINKCIESARLAPSACNSQPWKFIIFDEEESKNKLADIAFSGVYSMNIFAKKAPVLIVVVTDTSSYIARLGGFIRRVQYSLIDIGICTEHLCLEAQANDVGTCYLGWLNEKRVKIFLDLPKNVKIDLIISMGYPELSKGEVENRKSFDEICDYYLK